MTKEDKSRDIVSLTDVQHLLLRPQMYLGGVTPSERDEWVLSDDGSIKHQKVTYTEALLKAINEVIDNGLDEFIKTNGEFANKITVKIFEDKITITDNGRGLPIKKDSNGDWMPVVAFTKLKAGSNFTEDRRGLGTNGIGVSATNIFSKAFEVITCDGKHKMKISCKDNLSEEKHTLYNLVGGEKQGTKVSLIPDYKRFGVEGITPEIELMIKTRLRILSWFYPKCDFRYNDEKMSIKAKDIEDMFPQPSVVLNLPNVYILAYASEEPEILTYINGLSLRRGGTHIDYISNLITSDIREKLCKQYKNIKPSDIRNRLGLVVFFREFPNCQFDSQTKELLTNNERDIKDYLGDIDISSKVSKKILNDKDFVNNITDIFKLKEELAEQKELKKLNKKVKTIDSDKYFPPVAHSGKDYLLITEGYSAFSGLSKILNRKGVGYYSLKGKPLNAQDLSPSKFMQNQEISDLVNILGIDLSDPNTDMTYKKVVYASDQDMDGISIRALLTVFFAKIAPRMFKEGRICILNTPVVAGFKNNNLVDYYFDFPKSSDMRKDLKYKYYKGLGSWSKAELEQVISKKGGLENLLLSLTEDDDSKDSLANWFGDKTDARKEYLRGKEFHIDLM